MGVGYLTKPITVVYAGRKPQAVAAAKKLGDFLKTSGYSTAVLSLPEFETSEEKPNEGVIIVLGGDGTLLRVVRYITSQDVAILGVNFGRSGFLCQAEPGELIETVESILVRNPATDLVMRLAIYVNEQFVGNVLNEAYISSRTPGRIVEYALRQDGELIRDVADGVVVATPVGSTAYAMSAGGPAVDERLDAIIITPMASLLNMKPLVLPASHPVEIEIKKGEAQIMIDGHSTYPIADGPLVRVKKSEYPIRFIHLNRERPFARRVRKRLYGKI